MNKIGLLFIAGCFALVLSGIGQTEAVAQTESITAATTTQQVVPPQAGEDDLLPMATCFMCSRDSSGACSGAQQCAGTRKACRKKGCKITGTSSCSSAANVKKC